METSGFTYNKINIRKLEESDAPKMTELLNNRKVWDNLQNHVPFPYQLTDAHDFIRMAQMDHPCMHFGIDCDDGLCGVIGLTELRDSAFKTGEVGYWIGEPFWGYGIASRALKEICQYAFRQLGYNCLFAGVYEYNKASMRVLQKNGFIYQRKLQQAIFKKGRMWDEYRFELVGSNQNGAPC